MSLIKLLCCLAFVCAFCFFADAQTNSFEQLLQMNGAFPFRIQDGKLSGKGAELIDSSLRDVQFVALGEEHNKRAVHQFGGALFRLLHEKYDFNYLALEEDPIWGKMLSETARNGGAEAVINLALRYPNAFHLSTEDEMQMIGEIGKISPAKEAIWGLNQVFGAAHIYDRLVKIAPNKQARAAAQKLSDAALEYEKERFQKNVHYLVAIAKSEDFASLRETFKPAKNSEADFLTEQIALSHRIYAPYAAKPRPPSAVFYESGKMRETNMKRLFAQHYREAQKTEKTGLPKVMAMFGHLHLYRGLSERTEQYSLGNYLSELAIFNDRKSLHIYMGVDADYYRKSAFEPLARTASEAAKLVDASGAVIDLRQLFDYARNNKEMNPELRRLIMSYDIFLLLRDTETGSIKRLQTPNFRWYTN
jgi:hypothetical protein